MEHQRDLIAYSQHRDELRAAIQYFLMNDQRFVAAWLTGSFADGTADSISDLDLNIVVADAASAMLCEREPLVQAHTNPTRYALISMFGKPSVIHENHHNAPSHGTFTFVLYDSGLMIDWILIPQHAAQRPQRSQLLFETVPIPLLAESNSKTKPTTEYLAERSAFFWMMAAVTAKYIIRGDQGFVVQWLEALTRLTTDLEWSLRGSIRSYQRGSISPFLPSLMQQKAYLLELCRAMESLEMRFDHTDSKRIATIQALLALTKT